MSSIVSAVIEGDCVLAEAMLMSDAERSDSRDPRGNTPLHIAAALGRKDVVEVILAHGADVNARNDDRWTPLHRASDAPHGAELVRLLLCCGADPNAQNKDLVTPLHIAVWKGRRANTRVLLAFGADVEATTLDGLTPYSIALRRPRRSVLKLVEEWVIRRICAVGLATPHVAR